MFKRVFSFILIVVMLVCTITSEAKDVYFATHRFVINEYGELLPKSLAAAYCPTRIEVDYDAKILVIKTKTHGTAIYTFNRVDDIRGEGIIFFNEKQKIIGAIAFKETGGFLGLKIEKEDGTSIAYAKIDD